MHINISTQEMATLVRSHFGLPQEMEVRITDGDNVDCSTKRIHGPGLHGRTCRILAHACRAYHAFEGGNKISAIKELRTLVQGDGGYISLAGSKRLIEALVDKGGYHDIGQITGE